MRIGSIVGIKDGKISPIDAGNASLMKSDFKKKNYSGYDKVIYFDSSSGSISKKPEPVKKPEVKKPIKK